MLQQPLRGHDVDKLRDAIRAQALLWAPRYRGDDPYLCEGHAQPDAPLLPDGDVEDACGAKGAAIYSQVVPVEGLTAGQAFRLAHDVARDWLCSHPWVFRRTWLASEPWRVSQLAARGTPGLTPVTGRLRETKTSVARRPSRGRRG